MNIFRGLKKKNLIKVLEISIKSHVKLEDKARKLERKVLVLEQAKYAMEQARVKTEEVVIIKPNSEAILEKLQQEIEGKLDTIHLGVLALESMRKDRDRWKKLSLELQKG
jgi:hypothetical protein